MPQLCATKTNIQRRPQNRKCVIEELRPEVILCFHNVTVTTLDAQYGFKEMAPIQMDVALREFWLVNYTHLI